MRNKKMLWNNDGTKSIEAEKIKRLVIQRMTLFFENEDEDEFYTVKGCFTEDCNEDEVYGYRRWKVTKKENRRATWLKKVLENVSVSLPFKRGSSLRNSLWKPWDCK